MRKQKSLIKNTFILSSIFLLSILCLGILSAADVVTIDTPAAGGTLSGTTQLLNASLDSQTDVYNVSFYYQIGTDAWVLIANVQNTSIDWTKFNVTWDTTTLTDDEDINLMANATGADNVVISEDKNLALSLDNGNPASVLSSSSFHDLFKVSASDTFTIGINADSAIGISNCTYYYTSVRTGNVVNGSTFDATSNACTQTLTPVTVGLTAGESYTVLVQATDENIDNTNSSSRTLTYTAVQGSVIGGSGTVATQAKTFFGGEQVTTFINKIRNMFQNIWTKLLFWK